MTDAQVKQIADAVHDRLMNGPIKELQESLNGFRKEMGEFRTETSNHLDLIDADIKDVKDGLGHLDNRMNEHFGAA